MAAATCTVFGDGRLRLCDESDMLSSTWFHSNTVQQFLGFFSVVRFFFKYTQACAN